MIDVHLDPLCVLDWSILVGANLEEKWPIRSIISSWLHNVQKEEGSELTETLGFHG